MLGAPAGGIQVMGTYFPCPNTIGGHTDRLWDETLEWLEWRQLSESPHTNLQHQIQQRTLRHLSKAATGDRPARNIIIIGGDFSATWNWCHGPLKGLDHWATTSSLFSPLADLLDPTLLASYYQRCAQVHILLSQPCQGTIARGGLCWVILRQHPGALPGSHITRRKTGRHRSPRTDTNASSKFGTQSSPRSG